MHRIVAERGCVESDEIRRSNETKPPESVYSRRDPKKAIAWKEIVGYGFFPCLVAERDCVESDEISRSNETKSRGREFSPQKVSEKPFA
jgi:hypothetical protein